MWCMYGGMDPPPEKGHTMSNATTIHLAATYAAEGGGPAAVLPEIDPAQLSNPDTAAMALLFNGEVWLIADANGQVYAEATNPADLAGWLTEYTQSLGRMHERGEL
ncbi:hypothetical protein SEA_BROWNIE5_78 [Mycobacterium phage Brownie5]|uniref:Uncharacterized protein n=2 Tax=Rosebushvirus rosebush TaxID=2006145 RepID=A0A649VUU4_9CAUD|nr:hypothetical protein SEA_BROWNIE5_78 [Mycobacterium phage Brownie5]QGJ95771.1 hypothetical protein SEA_TINCIDUNTSOLUM_79 [Mycobacterium phage Tinciduntsolum]